MILQALKSYYDRKAADPDSGIAPEGWEWREFDYLALIDEQGNFISFQDVREGDGKFKRGHRYLVPALGEKKGSGIKANLLWENIEYVFGVPVPTKQKLKPDIERVKKQHKAFVEKLDAINGGGPVIEAIREALQRSDLEARLKNDPLWEELIVANPFVLLSIRGRGPVTDDLTVRQVISESAGKENAVSEGLCLVTGERTEMANLEPPIKGVRGAQTTGASLVSCNLSSFESYGKEQGAISPIGKSARFAYAAALNHLLGKGSNQKLQVGDSTVVFWAERDDDLEKQLADFFGEPPKDDPDRGVNAVKSLYKSIASGAYADSDQKNNFFVLGLAPNAARISVRFWIVDTVQSMSERIAQHFQDLSIIRSPKDKEAFSLLRLLSSIAVQEKIENVPPNLAGDTMRAILEGIPYPKTLLQAAVRRNRAEQAVPYIRAALIKACINRESRFYNPNQKEELKMSLDPDNPNIGYRLGRLFAALEKTQQEAHPGINATIGDRYYGAASSTPTSVFGTLTRLNKHHLAKLENVGGRINRERLIQEIMSGIAEFPAHLPLADQGRFAIGYYHQMQAFYTKKEKTQ